MDRSLSHPISFVAVTADQREAVPRLREVGVIKVSNAENSEFDHAAFAGSELSNPSSVRDRDTGAFPIPTHRDAT